MLNVLEIETGAEVVIKGQTKKEAFFLMENKDNGYSNLLQFDVDKDGYIKNNKKPKKITIPTCDIVGEQMRIF
jgi:hypothetical protein